MAAIYTVSWAVLAAMIGKGGLGEFVYQGTSSNNSTLILLVRFRPPPGRHIRRGD